jgi:hypothetical protein
MTSADTPSLRLRRGARAWGWRHSKSATRASSFVEAATQLLLGAGFMEREIRTERFGATGQP